MSNRAKAVVEQFWMLMATNDFRAASRLLADEYELHWPQSAERIVGCDNFATVNETYPAHGPWRFTINQLIAEGNQVVSDVTVTDGVITGHAITFSTVKAGQIVRQVEFWPEEYAAPEWRREWVLPLR